MARIGLSGLGGCAVFTDAPNFVDDPSGDFHFRMRGASGEILNRMPVTVAGQKIHRRVTFMGAHASVHQAHVLDELGPIECGYGPHAGDDVTNRLVVGDLVGMFPLHDFIQTDTSPV